MHRFEKYSLFLASSFTVQWYQSYNRQLFLVRCYVTSTRIPESSKAIAPEESSRQCEALTEETHDVESRDIWENLEHDVVDVTTFDLVKRHYLERIQEIENSDKDDHANKSIAPKKDAITNGVVRKKKKRSTRHPSPAKYVRGNQLTYQSEQNVLAEIDIYAFLGNVCTRVISKYGCSTSGNYFRQRKIPPERFLLKGNFRAEFPTCGKNFRDG